MKIAACMREWGKSRSRRQSGQIIIVVAISLVILLGFLGLATDLGYLRYMKREMQMAADAGAIAAGSALQTGVPGSHIQVARMDAAKNGFTHGSDGVTVDVNRPPLSGQFVGDNGYVEVIVRQDQPTFFMRVLGLNAAADVHARAVAGASSSGGACVYALSPDTKHSTLVNGGTLVDIDCGIYVNSSSPDAFNAACNYEVDGPSVLAASVCVTGGVTAKTIECTEPDPQTGCPPIADPLASLPEPGERPYVCDHIGCVINGGVENNCGGTGLVLNPGVYCDGIKIAKTDGVVLNPGMYIINGGGFIVSDATVGGDGVTLYNTGDATYDYGVITFAKDTIDPNAVLRAPTSGPYKGIVLFQDHNNTRDVKISSGACTAFEGVIYVHATNGGETLFEFNGGTNDCSAYEPPKMTIIGDVLHFQSHSFIFQGYPDFAGAGGGSGTPVLVE